MKICIFGAQGHLETFFDALDDHHVTGICVEKGEDISRLENPLNKANQSYKIYYDFVQMIEAEQPDIAVISSYPDKNAAAINHALQKGIHVFCEKPIAINMASFKEISKTLKNHDVKLYSMMTERFDPAFVTAYKAVFEGKVGAVRLIDTRKSYKLGTRPDYYSSRKTYAGTLSWVGIHAIDRIYRAAQVKFKTVFARSNSEYNNGHGDLETTAICSCEMSGDILASFTCDYYRPEAAHTHGDDRLRIVGTTGVLEVMDGKVVLVTQNEMLILPLEKPPHIFDEFLSYIKSGKSEFLTTDDCLYTTYAALKATISADTGRTIHF